jgi:hypothetical protein
MKLRTSILAAVATSAAMAVASAASAAITLSIYHTDPGAAAAAADATLAQAATMIADATLNISAIDFTNAPGNNSDAFTIGAFLNNPAGLNSTVAALTLDNTYFLFTGSTFLNAGMNSFVVPHDDGLQLNFPGLTPSLVIDQPGPTSEVDTPFNVNAPSAGVYAFQLSYGETHGGPAVLRFQVNDQTVGGGVPEPASWALMIVGFGGLGAMARRRKTMALTAV